MKISELMKPALRFGKGSVRNGLTYRAHRREMAKQAYRLKKRENWARCWSQS